MYRMLQICMCVHTNIEGENKQQQKCESWCLPLFCTHLRQTLWAIPCCIRSFFHLFGAHLQKSVVGNGEQGFVCLGQDCVIIVGSWSFFFQDNGCKDSGVSILFFLFLKENIKYDVLEARWYLFWFKCVTKICPTLKSQHLKHTKAWIEWYNKNYFQMSLNIY